MPLPRLILTLALIALAVTLTIGILGLLEPGNVHCPIGSVQTVNEKGEPVCVNPNP